MGANFDRAVRACVRRETVSFRGVRNTFLKAAKGTGNGSELGGGRSRSIALSFPIHIGSVVRTRTYLSLSIYRRKGGGASSDGWTGGQGERTDTTTAARKEIVLEPGGSSPLA